MSSLEPDVEDLEEPEGPPDAPGRPRLTGRTPRLPISRPERTSPTPPARAEEHPEPEPGPGPSPLDAPPGDPSSSRSSRASTDDDVVSPKDLKAAIRQAADVGFVLAGQGIGALHARARRQPKIASQWLPTPAERELVLDPAGRIIGRHIRGDVQTADAVDAALIAAGLGAFTVRAAFGLEPLPAKEPTSES